MNRTPPWNGTDVWLHTCGFCGGSDYKESAWNVGELGSIPELGRSPVEGNDAHSSILAWRIPRTEEAGGLQSTGSHRVGHDWRDLTRTHVRQHCYLCVTDEETKAQGGRRPHDQGPRAAPAQTSLDITLNHLVLAKRKAPVLRSLFLQAHPTLH